MHEEFEILKYGLEKRGLSIEQMKAEDEQAKIYGDDWLHRDYLSRRSHAAGEYCLIIASLAKAEKKADRRPGSIGARKARQKAKADRRKLKELERVIAESLKDYHPTEPRYISGPRPAFQRCRPDRTYHVHYWPKDCRPDSLTGTGSQTENR